MSNSNSLLPQLDSPALLSSLHKLWRQQKQHSVFGEATRATGITIVHKQPFILTKFI